MDRQTPIFSTTHFCSQVIPFYFLRSKKSPDVSVTMSEEAESSRREKRRIVCRQCGHTITTPDSILPVNGTSRHTCINPAGLTFQIICCSAADGCIVHGSPTSDHTWFDGYAWNYSSCAGCLIHLGWFYSNGNNVFWGLILERLDYAGDNA